MQSERDLLGKISDAVHRFVRYWKMRQEIKRFKSCRNVHELPAIFHYWSNKYLVPKFLPFGFGNPTEFFHLYMMRSCRRFRGEDCRFISIGSGNCDLEAELARMLVKSGFSNFVLECLDVNQHMLKRGRALAEENGLLDHMGFVCCDISEWEPVEPYHLVMVNHSLHHFVALERLFDTIHRVLHPEGFFVADDMIGRNGHMRWTEALAILQELWAELPLRYKYNHQLRRLEIEYENWDCSRQGGNEGVRSQDILPLLMKKFHFDLFVVYGNVIDIFVDRNFGHNFDTDSEFDKAFIDRVHAIDEESIKSGTIKPTHMTAAMTRNAVARTKMNNHLSPEFCVRWPDPG